MEALLGRNALGTKPEIFTKDISIEFLRSLSSDLPSPGFGCSGTVPEIEMLVIVDLCCRVLQ